MLVKIQEFLVSALGIKPTPDDYKTGDWTRESLREFVANWRRFCIEVSRTFYKFTLPLLTELKKPMKD